MTLVVDASLVVAALLDGGPAGVWAEAQLAAAGHLAAPHLMPLETANILRRAALAGHVSADLATLAHQDLLDLRVALFPYACLAPRVWELRANLTAYDACYVALAEILHAPLATLDSRLAHSPDCRCPMYTPD